MRHGFSLRRSSFIVSAESMTWLIRNSLTLAAYWAVLVYVYINSISPINADASWLYLRPNLPKEIESVAWALILLPTISTDWKRPSDFGLTILYFIGLVPTLVIFGLADQPRATMYTIIAGYLAVWTMSRAPIRIPFIQLRRGKSASPYIAGIGLTIILAWYLMKGNPGRINVDLSAVYNFRDEATSIYDVGPLGYLAAWTPEVLNPFLFCYFLIKRKWVLFGLFYFLQFYCLVIFQAKAVFIPCLMLPLLFFAGPKRSGRIWFIFALMATIIFCEAIYEIYKFNFFVQYWTRRFFFVQQFLYFNYFDVFKKIGLVYYSDSFLSHVIDYPFRQPPAYMVAYYMTGADSDPNTGFFGAGFMELGEIGVVLSGLIAGTVLRIFDRIIPEKMPMWFFGTMAFLPFMAMLVSQNVLTSMLTGGVFGLLILVMSSHQMEDKKLTRFIMRV